MVYFMGARPYDFTGEDGKQVSGVTAWFCDDGQKGALGFIPFKASYTRERFKEIFGSDANVTSMSFQPVEITYNRYGKPDSVSMLPEAPED